MQRARSTSTLIIVVRRYFFFEITVLFFPILSALFPDSDVITIHKTSLLLRKKEPHDSRRINRAIVGCIFRNCYYFSVLIL
jgi:hypothetical protein